MSYFFIFISSLVLLLLFFTFYKYQIRKIEKQNEILLQKNELEKNLNLSTLKAIKSQMNPHFFYNALNTIQSYILANDKKQAVNYLSKFSSLTRNILEMTEKEFISIFYFNIYTISLGAKNFFFTFLIFFYGIRRTAVSKCPHIPAAPLRKRIR